MRRKETKIIIHNITYKIAPRISLDVFISTLQFTKSTEDNKACVLFLLYELLKIKSQNSDQSLPTQEEINSITDAELHRFVHAIMKSDSSISNYYKAQKKTENVYSKFCKALIAQFDDIAAQMAQSLHPLMEAIVPMEQAMEVMIQHFIEPFRKAIAEFMPQFDIWTSKIIKALTPLIDGTVVENGKDSFEKWAKCGWTLLQNAPLDLFFTNPGSQQEADELALQFIYVDEPDFKNEFADLFVAREDNLELDEAITCFSHEHYRACALLLISAIEGHIIRYLKCNGNFEKLPVGNKAAQSLKELTTNSAKVKEKEFIYLAYWNVFHFMDSLFKGGDNFQVEPDFLNRNFLMHGMSKRKICRTDCVKLFLALQNILWLFK